MDGATLTWTNDQFSTHPVGVTFNGPMDGVSTSDPATGAFLQVTNVGRNGPAVVNISSTLTLNITADLNGTQITCADNVNGVVTTQSVTLELRGTYIQVTT